jgi:hypothetical protein
VTIYINTPGATPDQTTVNSTNTSTSLDVKIDNPDGRKYRLVIDKLDGKISGTTHRVKKDQVIFMNLPKLIQIRL